MHNVPNATAERIDGPEPQPDKTATNPRRATTRTAKAKPGQRSAKGKGTSTTPESRASDTPFVEAGPEIRDVVIADLVEDMRFQHRDLDEDTVAKYAQDLLEGVLLPPVIVFHIGDVLFLVAGYHRVGAAKKIGREQIQAEVRTGTMSDAIALSLKSNLSHGRPLSSDERKKGIQGMLRDPYWQSKTDTAIADALGNAVSSRSIARYRKEMAENGEAGVNPAVREHRTKAGKTRQVDTSKAGRKPRSPVPPSPKASASPLPADDDSDTVRTMADVEVTPAVSTSAGQAEEPEVEADSAPTSDGEQARTPEDLVADVEELAAEVEEHGDSATPEMLASFGDWAGRLRAAADRLDAVVTKSTAKSSEAAGAKKGVTKRPGIFD